MKYQKVADYLKTQPREIITLSFTKIEQIMGEPVTKAYYSDKILCQGSNGGIFGLNAAFNEANYTSYDSGSTGPNGYFTLIPKEKLAITHNKKSNSYYRKKLLVEEN